MVKWVVSSVLRMSKYKERARVIMNFLEIANVNDLFFVPFLICFIYFSYFLATFEYSIL